MPTALEVVRVQSDAAPVVTEICLDAAAWLKAQGIDQWQSFFDPEKRRAIMERRFREGEVFLATLDGVAVGTITLQWEDGFWAELGQDPSAGYIHTMAVRRDHARQGLGRQLLDWTAGYFSRAGKAKMRLDCSEQNLKLCRYYDALGFKTIGRKDWDGEQLVMKERGL